MSRAALYLRQSRDLTGEEHGVTRQQEDGVAMAKRRGWQIVATFTDNDTSAAGKKRRPGFEQLMEAIASKQVDAVIAWSFDRLTRTARDRLRLLEVGKANALVVALVRGSDLDLTTPAGRLTADILGSVAQHEIDQKGDRQARAALQRSEMGRPPMGVRLRGYTVSGELVEDEAVYVRQIFQRFSEGDSLRSLATWLAESSVPTRHGKPWNPTSVRTILVNPRYAGRAIYQGKTTGKAGGWTPLVDETTFDLVQARLADPKRLTHQGTDRKHLGSGLYLCALCEAPLRAWSGNRYRCPNACVNRSQGNIDSLVMQLITARLSRPDLANLLPEPNEDATRELIAELADLRTRLRLIEEDYDAGHIDGQRFAAASQRVKAQAGQVQAKLGTSASEATQILRAESPAQAFEEASLMLKRATINVLCTLKLRPAPRGRRNFDPASLVVEWKRSGSPADLQAAQPTVEERT